MVKKEGPTVGEASRIRKAGRPSLFRKEYVDQLIEFFSVEAFRKEVMSESVEYDAQGKVKKASRSMQRVPNKMPSLLGFAKSIGVDYNTVLRWTERVEDIEKMTERERELEGWTLDEYENYDAFRRAYKRAKELQKEFLIEAGMSGGAPPAFAIFVAKNITDMKDKTESEVTVTPKPLMTLPPKQLDARPVDAIDGDDDEDDDEESDDDYDDEE